MQVSLSKTQNPCMRFSAKPQLKSQTCAHFLSRKTNQVASNYSAIFYHTLHIYVKNYIKNIRANTEFARIKQAFLPLEFFERIA